MSQKPTDNHEEPVERSIADIEKEAAEKVEAVSAEAVEPKPVAVDNPTPKKRWENTTIPSVGSDRDNIPLSVGTAYLTNEARKDALNSIGRDNELTQDEKTDHRRMIGNMTRHQAHSDSYYERINQDDVAQYNEYEGDRTSSSFVKASLQSDGAISGSQVTNFINSSLGLGRPRIARLFTSGYSIRIDSFKEQEKIMLVYTLNEMRAESGYNSAGTVYSTDDVKIINELVDFIFSKVTHCTIKNWNVDILKSYLSTSDISHLLTNALACLYPTGYPISFVCSHYGNGCDYNTLAAVSKVEELPRIAFQHIMHYANSNITSASRTLTTAPWNSVELTQLEKYQEERGTRKETTPVNSTGSALHSLVLDIPNFPDYVRESTAVNAMFDEMVSGILDVDALSPKDYRSRRNSLINQTYTSLGSLKSSSWVKRIITRGTDGSVNYIEDRSGIIDALQALGASIQVKETISTLIDDFKANSATSLTGIYNFKCPTCNRPMCEHEGEIPKIMPINPTSYFFDIMVLRLMVS